MSGPGTTPQAPGRLAEGVIRFVPPGVPPESLPRSFALVEPLDPWIQAAGIDLDDFYPASLAQCETPDGMTLCLPWGCDVYALFWNKDLFKAAGLDPERPPQTMEELVEYADKLT